MNAYRILLAPWIATPRSTRWLLVAASTLLVVTAVLVAILGHPAHPWLLGAIVLGLGNGLWWALVMPNGLLLVLAARRLVLPGITRDVVLGMLLYAILWIAVPMLLHLPSGHVLAFAVVQILVAAAAMLYMLLPAYLGILFCLLPVLQRVVALPAIEDPRFVFRGGALALVLLLLLVWRWHQLLHGEIHATRWRTPTLINLRRNFRREQGDPLTDIAALRNRPAWLTARVDLRGVGARAPVKSLRVALGGAYLPQTMAGRLYRLIPAVLALLVAALFLFVITMGDVDPSQLPHYLFSRDGFPIEGWMFAVLSLVVPMATIELLLLRWGRVNAELPLLALLPGLSGGGDIKRVLLRTAVQRPAAWLVLLLLLGWLLAAGLGFGWPVALAMLAVALGCLAYLCAMLLGIFGGTPLSGFGRGLLMAVLFVLLSLTVVLPVLWQDWSAPAVARTHAALGVSWLALASFLLWFGHRGWSGLRRRPHPFMPN